MTQKEKYYYRKENRLCVKCGNHLEDDCTTVHCKKCGEQIRNTVTVTRHILQKNGLCPRCGKNKILGDEKQCLECNAKLYE